MNKLPHRHQLMLPVLKALNDLGGSGTLDEINGKVIELLKIPENLTNIPHIAKGGREETRSELEYQLAWARTDLRQIGSVTNSARGIWAITSLGLQSLEVGDLLRPAQQTVELGKLEDTDWRAQLSQILREKLSPPAFERLVQRILRESGFSQVEVLGRTGDGGIDGRGVARINGILSFRVVFQCKRYKGSVSPGEIRDFRGAMQGRADKGLFMTTGHYTRDAVREAVRDGAIAIDLVDGEKLVEKLRELQLGVCVKTIEEVRVVPEWFDEFEKAPSLKN